MTQSPSTSSGTALVQAGLLRKLEYAWIGTGTVVTVGGAIAAFLMLGSVTGGAPSTPASMAESMDTAQPGGGGKGTSGLSDLTEQPGSGMSARNSTAAFARGDWVEAFDQRVGDGVQQR